MDRQTIVELLNEIEYIMEGYEEIGWAEQVKECRAAYSLVSYLYKHYEKGGDLT